VLLKSVVPLLCLVLWAARAAAGTEVLSQLVIEGNDRTADSVIANAAGVEVGDEVDDEVLKGIERRVKNLAIFEEVQVSQQQTGRGARVVIRVEERWTLFPVPFFSVSGAGYGGGVFLLERNLFGYHKTVAAGGLYTTQGLELLGYYQDPSIAGSDFTLTALGSYVDEVRRRFDSTALSYSYRDTRQAL